MNAIRLTQSKQLRDRTTKIVIYILLIAAALFTTGPFLWMLSTALKTSGGVFTRPPQLLPIPPTLINFVEVWNVVPMGRWAINSVSISVIGTAGQIIINAMAGYALARFRLPGSRFILFSLLVMYMLPTTTNFLVNFLTIRSLGLTNTLVAVFLPSLASIFGIFLMRQAFLNVPNDLEESARIDGANEWDIFWRVMLPLVIPSLATMGIFSFVGLWNEFFWPLIVLTGDDTLFPLALGIRYLNSAFVANTRWVMAGGVITMIPTLIVFIAAQRYFISGAMAGAVKG
ncbi:MAG: ABC transporter permease subunit [Chloroflexi bacterium AL-W]|nr:ABC transporter permease subunit [Chloroflexi bacterium AL-N1]NOK66070.1 ABC transporter permease subunit [Chloroflexi bacterium AL-N10]NOK72951.1 ABC transporter permease subunit [Chloroflexi bacterium AL-N5]NOK79848.1 ABC transporter permease subunit [Chloroflexi bacterium AL-W]NOK88296.1 ABC transporter permease subunit [Chloroflexi bacterium AL-N15]